METLSPQKNQTAAAAFLPSLNPCKCSCCPPCVFAACKGHWQCLSTGAGAWLWRSFLSPAWDISPQFWSDLCQAQCTTQRSTSLGAAWSTHKLLVCHFGDNLELFSALLANTEKSLLHKDRLFSGVAKCFWRGWSCCPFRSGTSVHKTWLRKKEKLTYELIEVFLWVWRESTKFKRTAERLIMLMTAPPKYWEHT